MMGCLQRSPLTQPSTASPSTACHFHWFVDSRDDVVNNDVGRATRQPVAPARAPGALHQTRFSQLDKELFEIFWLYPDVRRSRPAKRCGPRPFMADIDHGHHRISALG